MFESLTDKFQEIFKKIKGVDKITESNINEAVREVRLALLEADVNFQVVKELINNIKEKAIGEKVIKSLTPVQQFIKIVNEELIKFMDSPDSGLKLDSTPSVIMLVGLQGSGKTTTAAKLANLIRKEGYKPMLVAADVYRPAAIEQLIKLGEQLNIPVYSVPGSKQPVEIAKNSIKETLKAGCNVTIIDTAGRLHIDDEMMNEVSEISKEVKPNEILFVADAMSGQDAVNVAKEFNNRLPITGIILTKLDGDARGGAAISVKYVINKPIKFVGVGEKIDNLEKFYADRMASRILGMGDILSLIEKAEKTISEEEAKKLEEKLKKGKFDLDDFLNQLQQIRSMGSFEQLLTMIPGFSQLKELKAFAPTEKDIKKTEAIIQSMTRKERANPEILNNSRKLRIAKGSGTTLNDINKLLKQYYMLQKMMKSMSKMNPMNLMKNFEGLFGKMF
ncbi:MAG TPA: signal recognition particle protein [bacterium]|nr:signal recognition particle protein [bacterium]HOL46940.1 signal recognition particle protein [bacterium]HPQ18206.1 signal recognition particle protein [bacterium]